jgi:glycerol-3-phosphate acyltransferase PlsX
MKANHHLPVAVDAMGGDHAPGVNVEGAIAAARLDGLRSVLVGDEDLIKDLIAKQGAQALLASGELSVCHAAQVVDMDDKPALALRKKKSSSMHVACELVNRGEALGVLSAGNSGAMMAIALFVLGRIDGVLRPAIGSTMPTPKGTSIVVDAGANTECLPPYLFQFALMGDAYMRQVLGIQSPRIGVLANGEEDSKGTELTRATLELLRQTDLNCIGHCEGRDVVSGHVDVVVCDGFSGNLVLKSAEGTASLLLQLIRQGYEQGGLLTKLGALFSRPMFRKMKKQVDPREFGAAPLLGLMAPAYIAHGSSDAYAIRRSIARVHNQSERDLSTQLISSLTKWQHLYGEGTPSAVSENQNN